MNRIKTTAIRFRLAAAMLLAATLCGCESDSDPSPAVANANMTGTWAIFWDSDDQTPLNTFIIEDAVLTQNGTAVTGSGAGVRTTAQQGQVSKTATITGTVRGDTFTFRIDWGGGSANGEVIVITPPNGTTFNGRGHSDWDNSDGDFTGILK